MASDLRSVTDCAIPQPLLTPVTEFDPETDTPISLVARADKAMYCAKSLGRNRVAAGSAMDAEVTRSEAVAAV